MRFVYFTDRTGAKITYPSLIDLYRRNFLDPGSIPGISTSLTLLGEYFFYLYVVGVVYKNMLELRMVGLIGEDIPTLKTFQPNYWE